MPAGAAGDMVDMVDMRGLNRLGEGHRRQDGGEPPGQHGLTSGRWGEYRRLGSERLHPLLLVTRGAYNVVVLILHSWYSLKRCAGPCAKIANI
jgi:hypothetical protein